MTRRLFLAACLLPLASVVSATPIYVESAIPRQWYGHVPHGYHVYPADTTTSLPWMPTEVYRVYQVVPSGSPTVLYIVR